ncbi:MAG: hypothetical protein NTW29_09835 [Bacteroidetes bacterium]|nr:hypothetical protein [Bacteroidota bacterium]
MPVTLKKKKTSKRKVTPVIDERVGNYEKHPFFVKKAREAKALLKTTGLPAIKGK